MLMINRWKTVAVVGIMDFLIETSLAAVVVVAAADDDLLASRSGGGGVFVVSRQRNRARPQDVRLSLDFGVGASSGGCATHFLSRCLFVLVIWLQLPTIWKTNACIDAN